MLVIIFNFYKNGKKFFINIILFSLVGLLIDLLLDVNIFKPLGLFLGAYTGFEKNKHTNKK